MVLEIISHFEYKMPWNVDNYVWFHTLTSGDIVHLHSPFTTARRFLVRALNNAVIVEVFDEILNALIQLR